MQLNIVNAERDSATGAIKVLHWVATKTAGEHTASSYGTAALGEPGETFVPYEEVTQELATEWLGGVMDLEATEAGLDTQLAALANPPVVSGLPWATTVTP